MEKIGQPNIEKQKTPELTAERIREIRDFVEASRDLGVSPREIIYNKVREFGISGIGKEMLGKEADKIEEKIKKEMEQFKNAPKWLKAYLERRGRRIYTKRHLRFMAYAIKETNDWQSTMGDALVESGVVDAKESGYGRDAYLKVMKNPQRITDPEKYAQVLKQADQKFLEENMDTEFDLSELTEILREMEDEYGEYVHDYDEAA